MTKASSTLPAAQRARVFDAYRGRGRATNQLWLVYSVKTGRDWILTSDRQFVHWLAILEANPLVSTFDFPVATAKGFAEHRVANVEMLDGSRERHNVYTGTLIPDTTPQADKVIEQNDCVKQEYFCDTQLKPLVPIAMRWHKALSFAAILRDQEQLPSRIALLSAMKTRLSGTVDELIADTQPLDEPVILGMLVRIAVEGFITLDLHGQGFCYSTPWRIREGLEHVDS